MKLFCFLIKYLTGRDTREKTVHSLKGHFLFPISAPFTILRMDYSNVFSESADEAESIDKMKTCVIPVLQYLKDNSHIQLAYQILHHMLYSVYQTALQHQMGIELNNEVCTLFDSRRNTKNNYSPRVKGSWHQMLVFIQNIIFYRWVFKRNLFITNL
jgi:hypothetical protein